MITGLIGSVAAEVSTKNVLVVYDDSLHDITLPNSLDATTRTFLKELGSIDGFKIRYKTYTDENLSLFASAGLKYDNLILLPSSKKTINDTVNFNQYSLVDFLNNNGNVLVVGGANVALPDDVRGFLNEIGIFPSPKNFRLYDHFNTEDDKVVLTDSNIVNNRVISSFGEKFLYDGSAALLSNNELLFPIVKGSKTSFTSDSKSNDPLSQDKTWTFGEQGFVAAGFQALNNARLVWVGADSLLDVELAKWAFQQKGVLKLQFVQHYKKDAPENINDTLYRIKDNLIYTIGVSELVNNEWVPYEVASEEDQIQLSFKMLDPYQRLNLKKLGPGASTPNGPDDLNIYSVDFLAPDHHGMFTFELDYKRTGLSYLSDNRVVALRHLANDEYKRSWDITNSWLYIASAVLVVAAWLLFVVNFIFVGKTNTEKKNI